MSKKVKKTIRVTNLLLNVDNPRFDTTANQREAISTIIHELGKKMLVLIRSIIEEGLNPSELLIVMPNKSKYRVLEGNRRIAALKLMQTPDMFKNKYKSFTNGLNKILKEQSGSKINEVDCVVFTDESEANRWIKLRHTGENNGKGIVPWDAQQIGRFDAMVGGKERVGLQAINFLKNFNDKGMEEKLQKISITNLERLLTDRYIQSVLGLEINDGKLETSIVREEIKKGLLKIVDDFTSGKVKVKDIYTKDDRRDYVSKYFKEKDVPNLKKLAENSWQLNSPTKVESKTKKRIRLPSIERNYLIPPNCILNVNETKTGKIYGELRKLEVSGFKYAVAVLFRVFMEMSADKFSEKYKLPLKEKGKDKTFSLSAKLNNIAKYMSDNGMATKNELKGIRTITQGKDSMCSINTFNDYVHNRHFSPTVDSLKTNWDNIQIFMQKLWENV